MHRSTLNLVEAMLVPACPFPVWQNPFVDSLLSRAAGPSNNQVLSLVNELSFFAIISLRPKYDASLIRHDKAASVCSDFILNGVRRGSHARAVWYLSRSWACLITLMLLCFQTAGLKSFGYISNNEVTHINPQNTPLSRTAGKTQALRLYKHTLITRACTCPQQAHVFAGGTDVHTHMHRHVHSTRKCMHTHSLTHSLIKTAWVLALLWS